MAISNELDNKTDRPEARPRKTLAEYWDDEWHSPNSDESWLCMALFAVVAALLVVARYFYTLDSVEYGDWALTICALKLLCGNVEFFTLWYHQALRHEYHARFQKHAPIDIGVVCACVVLIFRTLVLQYDIDISVLVYQLETWFWVGYWLEWWTGMTKLGLDVPGFW